MSPCGAVNPAEMSVTDGVNADDAAAKPTSATCWSLDGRSVSYAIWNNSAERATMSCCAVPGVSQHRSASDAHAPPADPTNESAAATKSGSSTAPSCHAGSTGRLV